MRKRILFLPLIALLMLPVPGITQDVEIQDIEIKWLDRDTSYHQFRAKVWVTNTSETTHRVHGRLVFYDRDGFEIRHFLFAGEAEAGATVPLRFGGSFGERAMWEVQSYKVTITRQTPIRR